MQSPILKEIPEEDSLFYESIYQLEESYWIFTARLSFLAAEPMIYADVLRHASKLFVSLEPVASEPVKTLIFY